MGKENPDGLLALALVPVRDVLVKIAQLLEKVLEKLDQIAERMGVPAIPAVPAPPVKVEVARCTAYKIFEIDLTVAHTDELLGLKELLEHLGVPYAKGMTILDAPSAFSYKVNNIASDPNDAVIGDEWENWEITEVYVTNVVGAGTGLIFFEW